MTEYLGLKCGVIGCLSTRDVQGIRVCVCVWRLSTYCVQRGDWIPFDAGVCSICVWCMGEKHQYGGLVTIGSHRVCDVYGCMVVCIAE